MFGMEKQQIVSFSAPPDISFRRVGTVDFPELAQKQQQQQGNFSLDSYHFAYAFDETHAHLVH